MAQVRLRADDANINPNSIVSRKELLQLINGERDLALLSDWRKDMVGLDLLATLDGKSTFSITNGGLIIKPV